jgi:hypothetical protein
MCCTAMPNKGTYKGASAGTVCDIVTDMSEEEKQQKQTFVSRCLQGVSSCLLGLVSCVIEHHTGDYIKHKESVEEVLLGLAIATLVGDSVMMVLSKRLRTMEQIWSRA